MNVRFTVATVGATLALAIMVTTTTTPAFAAKSNGQQVGPPTVVETKGAKSKGESTTSKFEQTTSKSVRNVTSPKPEVEPTPPEPGDSVASAGSEVQRGTASTVSSGMPGIPSGSVVPSGSYGPPYQQVPLASVGSTGTGPAYQQGTAPGTAAAGSTQQQGPAPLFQMPATNVGAGTDLRVVYVNSASNNTSTLYHFRVENPGSQPATGIRLASVVREQSDASGATRRVEQQYAPIVSLSAGQFQDVVVTCTPQAGFRCMSGSLDAYIANDPNPANNGANS